MKHPLALLLTCGLCAALTAPAATVRTATETFVTNKVNALRESLTDGTITVQHANEAAQASFAFSASGAYLAEVADRLRDGNLHEHSTDAILADIAASATRVFVTNKIAEAIAAIPTPDVSGQIQTATNALATAMRGEVNAATNALAASLAPLIADAATRQDVAAATNAALTSAYQYTDAATNALSASFTPGVDTQTVTNIVRDLSLGGIWDSSLQIWWTPRMVNGSLTYHATTNVNMNAED